MYSRNDLQFEYRDTKRALSQQGFPFSTNSIKEKYEQGTLSLSPPLNTCVGFNQNKLGTVRVYIFRLYEVSIVNSLSILNLH